MASHKSCHRREKWRGGYLARLTATWVYFTHCLLGLTSLESWPGFQRAAVGSHKMLVVAQWNLWAFPVLRAIPQHITKVLSERPISKCSLSHGTRDEKYALTTSSAAIWLLAYVERINIYWLIFSLILHENQNVSCSFPQLCQLFFLIRRFQNSQYFWAKLQTFCFLFLQVGFSENNKIYLDLAAGSCQVLYLFGWDSVCCLIHL